MLMEKIAMVGDTVMKMTSNGGGISGILVYAMLRHRE